MTIKSTFKPANRSRGESDTVPVTCAFVPELMPEPLNSPSKVGDLLAIYESDMTPSLVDARRQINVV